MDTNQIKRFAIEARNKLKEGVAMKMASPGFTKKAMWQRICVLPGTGRFALEGTNSNGDIFPPVDVALCPHSRQRDERRYEEAAYTWFNRLVAIRILQRTDWQNLFSTLPTKHVPHALLTKHGRAFPK